MIPAAKTDYKESAKAFLIDQFKKAANIRAILDSYTPEFQELETAIWDVINKRLLDVAVDAQLDAIGRFVDEPRGGRLNDDYRLAIKVKLRALRSQGRAVDVIDVILMIDPTAEYEETGNASFYVQMWNSPGTRSVAKMIHLTRAKAIGGDLITSNWDIVAEPVWFLGDSLGSYAGTILEDSGHPTGDCLFADVVKT